MIRVALPSPRHAKLPPDACAQSRHCDRTSPLAAFDCGLPPAPPATAPGAGRWA
ncbi:hypothetical protein T492DRAFT_997653 [Pavlovales sp. CCMP2436]|nr:hypothetical protein T492DRAFT_997653 [Pavlovales sp. CCMP2436]